MRAASRYLAGGVSSTYRLVKALSDPAGMLGSATRAKCE
jgi:hypothetical protein